MKAIILLGLVLLAGIQAFDLRKLNNNLRSNKLDPLKCLADIPVSVNQIDVLFDNINKRSPYNQLQQSVKETLGGLNATLYHCGITPTPFINLNAPDANFSLCVANTTDVIASIEKISEILSDKTSEPRVIISAIQKALIQIQSVTLYCGFNEKLNPIDLEKSKECTTYARDLFINLVGVFDSIKQKEYVAIFIQIQQIAKFFNLIQTKCQKNQF